MNFRLTHAVAALGGLTLVSCYPYNENSKPSGNSKKDQKQEVAAAGKKELKPADAMKNKNVVPKEGELVKPSAPEVPTLNKPSEPPAPVQEKRVDYPVATKAPGKEGFVLSPYNNKLVDVRDMGSGTLVQDPTYTGDGKGYFRVP